MERSSRGFFQRIVQPLGMALLVLIGIGWAGSALADPPGRVGRIADLNGQVWLYSPDAGEWIEAQRNRPLTNGDRLSTDAGARAEVRIGSTTVRLNAGTELEVLAIDDDHISLQLHSGSVGTRLRSPESAREFELKTDEGRFTAQRPGAYRFDRNDATSSVTVWNGEAQYEGPGSALTVNLNQRAEFWIDRNNAAQYSITEPARDAFATWNGERDRKDDRSASTRYVSPEMTGVEDLDRYGRWEQAPDYGNVWVPRDVPVGWAPYGFGHWAFVSPWGWTWVDDQPWGFAPFHYGRWVNYRQRWCWVPGTYVRHPVYAPALVGWVGGSNLSVSISIGGGRAPAVGWFPLAPREVYVPTYRVSPTYVRNVNITHVTNITNITTIVNNPQAVVNETNYQNRRFPHAVTVVPQTVMLNRQPVAPVAAQFRNTPVVQQLVTEPPQRVVVAAPPVAAPPAPAAVQAWRARQERGAGERHAGPAATPAPMPAVPPSPVRLSAGPDRRGEVSREAQAARAQEAQARAQAQAESQQAAAARAEGKMFKANEAELRAQAQTREAEAARARAEALRAQEAQARAQAQPTEAARARTEAPRAPEPPARIPVPPRSAQAEAPRTQVEALKAQEAQARAQAQAESQQAEAARAQGKMFKANEAELRAQAQTQQAEAARARAEAAKAQEAQAQAQARAQAEAQQRAQAQQQARAQQAEAAKAQAEAARAQEAQARAQAQARQQQAEQPRGQAEAARAHEAQARAAQAQAQAQAQAHAQAQAQAQAQARAQAQQAQEAQAKAQRAEARAEEKQRKAEDRSARDERGEPRQRER